MTRRIQPRAVIAPQTDVIIYGSQKLAFFPVIDPTPVCRLRAHVVRPV